MEMKVGINPPPGFVLENGTLMYFAREFVDGSGNSQDFDMNVVVNRTLGLWTTNLKLLGADYSVAAAIPLGNFAAPRPEPGDKQALGLGDIYLQPFTLGWHQEAFHVTAAYGVFAPTGRFTPGAKDNTGRGFWSNLLTVGTTYLQEAERPWHFTLQGRYEIPMEIRDTNITPGQAFVVEYGVGKQIHNIVDLGVVGYGAMQTTDISGSDFTGDPAKYQYFGIGPEIQVVAVNRPGWKMAVLLRSYFDFHVKNAPQGNFTVLSFGFVF